MRNPSFISQKDVIFARKNKDKTIEMARPIKETPILYGEDAERFVKEMQRVEALSSEERAYNRQKVREGYERAKKYITFCW